MHAAEWTTSPQAIAAPVDGVPAIPFEMAVLPNGLTLIVHEDRRHPLICTQLRFNVGSKDEPAGRTGFAHLFEHLMFKESANRRGNWHRMLQAMGGIGVNGTTSPDRTNYFQTVPSAALDQLLWMESDRMGHLLAGIDAKTLADEVLVIKNEKREREGAPYGGVYEAITTALYPRDHPYGHTVLGSFEDLDNAGLDTVADWYARWYGASNAVLVISGDIGFEEALAKVEHWFGAILPGTPARRATQWLPEVRDTKRITLFDRVPLRRLYSIWSTPQGAHPDSTLLQIVATILTGGAHSRLAQRLINRERLCLGISASQDGRYLCGEFQVLATLAPGVEPTAVEAAIDEEIARFVADGPTSEELDRVRKSGRNAALRMLDGIGSITETLASNMIVFGRPDGHLAHIEMVEQADAGQFRTAAAQWLSRKALVLDVRPFDAVRAPADLADRASPPPMGKIHAPRFPPVEEARLDNGLTIQLARQPATHGVEFSLQLPGGAALDPVGKEGLSRIALGTMDGGTVGRKRLDISRAASDIGIRYGVGVSQDNATLSMSVLKSEFGRALSMMAEILLETTYPEDEVHLFLDRQIVEARGHGRSAKGAAAMAISPLIYGSGHPYGRSSVGTVRSLSSLDRDQIIARHQDWLTPSAATLVVVGDLALDDVISLVDRAFGDWAPSSPIITPRSAVWAPRPGRYCIDRAGNPQSALQIAMASPQIMVGNEALMIFNSLFGGSFSSRINANLRERRGWTYGANSALTINRTHCAFTIATEVQADRTLDALNEIERELVALTGERPPTGEEIEEARHAMLVSLPSRWAGNGAVLGALLDRLTLDLPADYHDGIERRIRAVTQEEVMSIATLLADPAAYSWIVAGDPADIRGADMDLIDEHGRRH